MNRYILVVLLLFFASSQAPLPIQAANHWTSGAKLGYYYTSSGEPAGAASAVSGAATSWNTAMNCFTFEPGAIGPINWITDQSTWDLIPESTKNGAGASGTDFSTNFFIYFNVAYYSTSQWSTISPCDVGKLDVKSISLHELGHVLGLDNCDDCLNTVMKTTFNIYSDCWLGPFQTDKDMVNSYCSNPAATVYGFSVSDGIARWRVTSQYKTEGYVVEGASNPNGSWQTIATEPPTVGNHTVAVSPCVYYRLREIEQDGGSLIHGIAVDAPPVEPPAAESPSLDVLHAIIAERKADLLASMHPGAHVASTDTMLIVTTDSLASECSYGIADYWRSLGATVSLLTVDGFDSDPNVRRAQLHATIIDSVSGGVNCVLFVGDANDHVQFDMDDEGPQWWPESWDLIHSNYLAAGFPATGQPDHDLIPAWYEPDTLPRKQNTAYMLPYVPYLGKYADIDGDGIPDIPWGCLPFTITEEVAGYACKLWSLYPTVSGAVDVAFYVCDRDYGFVGDGAVARAGADAVEAVIPSWVNRHHLYATDVPDDGQRNTAAANLWNGSGAGIHVLMGSFSNRYKPADFFDKASYTNPWHMGMISPYMNYYPLVIANSCSGGDWARTEDPEIGTPILEDFLAAYDRGAFAWVGPSVGTWQHANVIFGEYFLEELYAYPTRSMAASFLTAQRRMLEDPALDAPTKLVARMMCFFGDPLVSLNELAVPTVANPAEVPPTFALEQNVPNPFNPATTIRYSIAETGRVTLKIYNAAGQLLRTLVDEEQRPRAGGFSVTWDGTNDAGRRAGSGVYFCRLFMKGTAVTKKMVALK